MADAARRARQEKKKAGKSGKVITDDDLASTLKPGGVTVAAAAQQQAGTASSDDPAKADPADPGQAAASNTDQSSDDPKLAALKEELATSEKDLDLLKRGYALDNEAYYSKPDYSSDPGGKARLDSEQQQIADKQREVEDLKARLAALEERQKQKKTQSVQQASSPDTEKPASPPQR